MGKELKGVGWLGTKGREIERMIKRDVEEVYLIAGQESKVLF